MSTRAVVTGGARGIGRAIAEKLLARGDHVHVLDLLAPDWSHARMHATQVDLSDSAAVRGAAATLAGEAQATHFIHCAGAIRPALLEDAAPADMEALSRLHLATPLALAQALLPAMKQAGHGRIVFIASRAALGLATRSAYAATKAGMFGLARTWALELGAHGITVNVVAPGPIAETENFHEIVPRDPAVLEKIALSIPVRRLGMPEDVANAVVFLAGDGAGFITGQVLYVCGGTSVGSLVL